jgi:hypothetical protein
VGGGVTEEEKSRSPPPPQAATPSPHVAAAASLSCWRSGTAASASWGGGWIAGLGGFFRGKDRGLGFFWGRAVAKSEGDDARDDDKPSELRRRRVADDTDDVGGRDALRRRGVVVCASERTNGTRGCSEPSIFSARMISRASARFSGIVDGFGRLGGVGECVGSVGVPARPSSSSPISFEERLRGIVHDFPVVDGVVSVSVLRSIFLLCRSLACFALASQCRNCGGMRFQSHCGCAAPPNRKLRARAANGFPAKRRTAHFVRRPHWSTVHQTVTFLH